MRAYEVIQAKRDGRALSPEVLRELVNGYVAGDVPDYQMAAFCMAVFFRGMTDAETGAFTEAMLRSGDVLELSDVPGFKVDKHSTGGVGDKISIPLAPIAAACGVVVPMISGRGLGHTGGTLDKLESIPGFDVRLPVERFREVLRSTGACLIGQTDRLAPADRRLYALRDVTATVESIPLIASSIMSKKLAEGIDGLVLDVKVGSGAFMKTREQAERLAGALVGIGCAMGKRVVARLTNMSQPLGEAVGNALEIRESIEVLRGAGPADVRSLTIELAAEMIVLAGRAASLEQGRGLACEAIRDGSALERLRRIVEAQGGDVRAVDDPDRLPSADATVAARAPAAGTVVSIDTQAIGLAAVALGAGRARVEDGVDHGVGLLVHKKVGDRVERGEPLCTVCYRTHAGEPPAVVAQRVVKAYQVEERDASPDPLLIARIAR